MEVVHGCRLSDCDHLFTGESGDYEEPFERDGTTRQGPFPGVVYLSVDRASGSPVRKGICESSGVPRLRQDASEMYSDVPLVTLAPRGIFRVPYWTPSDASVIR
ncbi:hypothetical protein CRG98_021192 [Punica granatum]|uniref:Uncharacterized protein n=1 Tax=Punica granatum TaxID=22663 RepID=A0A2I0JQ58_PUNGR|nr:hypothetical protein CRG98_021192 [Punica granatum]